MPTTKHNLISLRIGIPKFLVLKGPEKKQDMKVLHMSGRSERYVADPIIHHAFFLRSESTLCHSELLILGNIFYYNLFYSILLDLQFLDLSHLFQLSQLC